MSQPFMPGNSDVHEEVPAADPGAGAPATSAGYGIEGEDGSSEQDPSSPDESADTTYAQVQDARKDARKDDGPEHS